MSLSDETYGDGWRPSWRQGPPGPLPTHKLANLPDPVVEFDPMVFGPVETQAGDDMRRAAIEVLGAKVEKYRATAKARRLTGLETRDLQEAESAIQTLRKMAPVGELRPPRAEWT